MISRMDKYETNSVKARTEKNKKLYDEVPSINVDYIDINFDNAIEIKSLKNDNLTRSEYQRQKEIKKIIPQNDSVIEEITTEIVPEQRVYDINEILKLARENKLFEDDEKKRLINTEYNILTKLDIAKIEEAKEPSRENLRELIDTIYGNDKYKKKENEEEDNTDLFEDLIDKDQSDKSKTKPILNEEISKNILDKDFDSNETKTIELESKKEETTTIELENQMAKSKKTLTVIIVLVIILLLIGGYLFYKYFIS